MVTELDGHWTLCANHSAFIEFWYIQASLLPKFCIREWQQCYINYNKEITEGKFTT